MLLLVNGATRVVKRLSSSPNLGVLTSPRGGHSPAYLIGTGLPWAMDNDAFSAGGFIPAAFMDRLYQLRDIPGCLFVCLPDVPGDAQQTMIKFAEWVSFVRYLQFPVALAAQDGLEDLPIPWSLIDCLFIGGSTTWKLSKTAALLVEDAKQRGKWVHMGRVNSYSRIAYAKSIGCDSVDGTHFSIEPRQIEKKLPAVSAPTQTRMFK